MKSIASPWPGLQQGSTPGYQTFEELSKHYGNSFYLLDTEKLRSNFQKINEAFKSRYENFIIGYSYKTNYLPFLCKELSRLGAYAEVVSRLEYDLAVKIGEDPERIIFNGPLKSREDLELALGNGSILNIDSITELEEVVEYASVHPDRTVKVGIRVNFDLAEGGKSPLQEGYRISRFGICAENGQLEEAILRLQTAENIQVAGLHGHFSTRNRAVANYRKITLKLCEIAIDYLPEGLEYIDVGGGLYGELPDSFNLKTPSFDDYASAICGVMNEKFGHCERKPVLILEPGIAMVANVFTFAARVMGIKRIQDTHFVLTDGSIHNIKPTMHKNNLPMQIFRQSPAGRKKQNFHLVGYTCMEKDYLASDVLDVLPEVGDFVLFENVGAYTIVFNPPFIRERPAIIALDGQSASVVRKRETIRQFFNEEIYCF